MNTLYTLLISAAFLLLGLCIILVMFFLIRAIFYALKMRSFTGKQYKSRIGLPLMLRILPFGLLFYPDHLSTEGLEYRRKAIKSALFLATSLFILVLVIWSFFVFLAFLEKAAC